MTNAPVQEDIRLIQIVGDNFLLNELLATHLKRCSNLECRLLLGGRHASEKPISKDICLTLIDSTGIDLRESLDLMKACCSHSSQECLFAFFNANPESGIENDAIRLGARGVFYTNDSPEIICKGVEKIIAGEFWYGRKALFDYIHEGPSFKKNRNNSDAASEEPVAFILTSREKATLRHLKQGASNQEIANLMSISIHTVKSHLYNLYKKINVPNRFQAILWAESNLDR